ncbi:MAG: hypothetical protein WC799_17190 [Desulfobacteraceae bacterium]
MTVDDKQKKALHVRMIAVILLILGSCTGAFAAGKKLETDRDGNGKTDQVVTYNESGKIIRIDVDNNGDGAMDQSQIYQNENLIRVERDTNFDRKVDCIDHMNNNKCVSQEMFNASGRKYLVKELDSKEKPLRVERDTNDDGIMDTVHLFEGGVLIRTQQDKDNDGKPDITQVCRGEQVLETSYDADSDGKIECIIAFDEKGKPREERKDANKDEKFDTLTRFQDGIPVFQEKDSDFDGKNDLFSHFDKDGRVQRTEEDRKHRGKIDRIQWFERGTIVKITMDEDGDSSMESVVFYKHGKAVSQTQDRNGDGIADVKIRFNSRGLKEYAEYDNNYNKMVDMWEYCKDGKLTRIEKSLLGKRRADLKEYYTNGKKEHVEQDKDGDGRFEVKQWFNKPPFTAVVEMDTNGNGKVEQRLFYYKDILKKKSVDENEDGNPELVEYYSTKGKLEKSEEYNPQEGYMTWYFDAAQKAMKAEHSLRRNGRIDTWYVYQKGMLKKISEDSNGDGKADIWEEYDSSEALKKRKRDLNFDGSADVTDDFLNGQVSHSAN